MAQIKLFDQTLKILTRHYEEIKTGQYRELAPLLVTLVKQPDRQTLQQERNLILQEPDEGKRSDLFALAVTLAARYFDRDFLWRFFQEEVEMIKSSSFAGCTG